MGDDNTGPEQGCGGRARAGLRYGIWKGAVGGLFLAELSGTMGTCSSMQTCREHMLRWRACFSLSLLVERGAC